jgi:hypothetical protein
VARGDVAYVFFSFALLIPSPARLYWLDVFSVHGNQLHHFVSLAQCNPSARSTFRRAVHARR